MLTVRRILQQLIIFSEEATCMLVMSQPKQKQIVALTHGEALVFERNPLQD